MEKVFIKNRKGQKISALIDESKNQKGLVFILHGLGGFKEQPHIQTFIKIPVLLIVGRNDESTPLEHQRILFDALKTDNKELHLIKGAPHAFSDKVHLDEIYDIFDKWIKKYL
ncbi:hypothetical protein A3B87_00700 [Candidatus Kuenenbacteria bacterium RIFCSPHIGHO2_02_FULL_39_13]|uniref:Dienelactone hydrolase domain-containing protein n=1 Tax=Candidatus Kuenenbacteria bacterium RIFCSPHIGHO2_02_FULL_39_13 TaxID=1798561 RepID=A0A1F6FP41_9BACT|nr:MAG: hypothetical protein A3B87_00700 [Candidatus Kuenenbacteria bacterium RIFCSPHIGHO2_02_FULL_39_13]